ncbi:sugar transporter [Aliiroseovarius sp. KMU-50]|uniref:Sugar transporter n=1 Tax=Aliiroseovarius salicola TaxID=3009082 RepID=A0ABT4W4E5_9RHOB|nr:sugar transporter [Aliiroseovarius sp. KMU-50]MDA5095393.1 sugar transporter [Aliiroseovarius sp. KMU-50]
MKDGQPSREKMKPTAASKLPSDEHSISDTEKRGANGRGKNRSAQQQGGAGSARKKAQQKQKQAGPMRQPASPATVERRHRGIMVALFLVVFLPSLLSAAYLYLVARDQYSSTMGFSVQSQDASSAVDILGGITQLSGSSGSDTDILFEFMSSQTLVRAVDDKLNLRQIYHMPSDPVFGLPEDSTIEDLVQFWSRVVKVYYSASTGLIEVQVLAFKPEDAQRIGRAIYNESVQMINELSISARNDATQYAREELLQTKERLKDAREAVQQFRLRTQIVDPEADILGRMGVLNSLQNQLASAEVELDLLLQTAGGNDPRIGQMERRVDVIKDRLSVERERFSSDEGSDTGAYAKLVGEYERLAVDLQFAETAYLAALAAVDAAVAEASRKSRYLAAYIEPTLAESPEYPQREIISLTIFGFLFAMWAIGTMVFYSLRDRR